MIASEYHQSTKHFFNRFAPSLGYLDWATQPDPFRRYPGAALVELPRHPIAAQVRYGALYDGTAEPRPFDLDHLGELLRCSMGLSAWKEFGASRWALRVNPSSGNLHPTEVYLVHEGRVSHYAPREHALEERASLDPAAWAVWAAWAGHRRGALIGLTSIHWREAWKYGARAFRYCQHDTGHAIAAVRLAASMLGWRLALLPRWSTADLATLLGVDRSDGIPDAEREEPECLAIVTPDDPAGWLGADPSPLVEAARAASWQGRPNQLSSSHVEWPEIDEVARATRYPGSGLKAQGSRRPRALVPPEAMDGPPEGGPHTSRGSQSDVGAAFRRPINYEPEARSLEPGARAVILQRRSAVAFDGQSTLPRATFLAMLQRLQSGTPPWDALESPPLVQLALFVHRVDGLAPGLYAWLRDPAVVGEWRAAMRTDFLWDNVPDVPNDPHLFLLLPFDMTWPANRVSCDQEIAADGFFSLGMIARFESSLRDAGEWVYRRLFWECGMIGQVLYLEAEAAGARATGIGCYYDDPVHEMLGLHGQAWQSLYHFSMGVPVDDPRITSEPGYAWERS